MSDEIAQAISDIRDAAAQLQAGLHAAAVSALDRVQSLRSPEVMNAATAVLEEMDAIKATMEDGEDDFVARLSHAAYENYVASRVLRGALVRDWNSHWSQHSGDIVTFLENYMAKYAVLLAHGACTSLLGDICLAHSMLWKLQWGSDGDVVMENVHRILNNLISVSDNGLELGTVGRVLARTTIEEFGLYHPNSQTRGLTIAAHESCRQSFEQFVLLPVVNNLVSHLAMSSTGNESEKSVAALLQGLYAALCWRFGSNLLDSGDSSAYSDAVPELLPAKGDDWGRFVVDGVQLGDGSVRPVIDILAEAFRNFTQIADTEGQNVTLQCMVQVCSFAGDEWDSESRALHADRCMKVLFEVAFGALDSGDFSTIHVLQSACTGLYRLVSSVVLDNGLFAHPDLENAFIAPLVRLTQQTIRSCDDCDDEGLTECVDFLLKTWLELVATGLENVTVRCSIENTYASSIAESSATVLQVFVRAKVHRNENAADNESTHADEYAQSSTHLVALLGRHQPSLVSRFLIATLTPLSQQYFALLNDRNPPTIQLHEALWYVLAVAAKFIGDSDEAERPCIPAGIIELALELEKQYPEDTERQINSNEMFQLISGVASFSADLIPMLQSNMVSPGVCEAILLFYQRYIASYVCASEDYHADFSEVFVEVFGAGEDICSACLNFAAATVEAFYSDKDVMASVSECLYAFIGKSEDLNIWAIDQDSYRFLITAVCGGDSATQIVGSHRGKIFGFLMSVCPLDAVHELVLDPVGSVLEPAINAAASSTVNIADVCSAIQTLEGAFSAIRTPDVCRTVFPSLSTLITASANILQANAESKVLLVRVLKLFDAVVVGCGSFLESTDFLSLVELALGLVDFISGAMARSQEIIASRDVSDEVRSQEEDERLEVLVAAADLVHSVATWGLLDFMMDDRPDVVSNLSVQGTMMVLQFSDSKLLEFPGLRTVIFKLLSEVARSYTTDLLSVRSEDAAKVLRAIEYGVESGVPELIAKSYGTMESIAEHCLMKGVNFELIEDFLQSIIKTVTSGKVSHDVVPTMCSALFVLAGAYGPEPCANLFLTAMQDNSLLEEAYSQMSELLQTTNFESRNRNEKHRFASRMREVLATVKGTQFM